MRTRILASAFVAKFRKPAVEIPGFLDHWDLYLIGYDRPDVNPLLQSPHARPLPLPCFHHPPPRARPSLPAAADPRAAGHGGGAVGACGGAGAASSAAAVGGAD